MSCQVQLLHRGHRDLDHRDHRGHHRGLLHHHRHVHPVMMAKFTSQILRKTNSY